MSAFKDSWPEICDPIRVATFNIRTSLGLDGIHSWWFRRAACAEAITALQADVIMLQEVRLNQLVYLRRRLKGYNFVSAGRNDGRTKGERLAIAVHARLDWQSTDPEVRWFSDSPMTPSRFPGSPVNRIAVFLTVCGINFVCVHLDESPNTRSRRCVELLAEWFGDSAVIMGDFNVRIDDPVLAPLWSVGYRDALQHLPAEGPLSATHHSFTGSTDGSRIDHILIPSSLKVLESSIERAHRRRLPSDHWPVVATLVTAGMTTGSGKSGTT